MRQRKQEGQRILFVGDEINDAAAMAESDVAIALGSEPLARAAADIEWPAPVLSALPKAISHSRATVRLIGSNLLIAMSYNLARNRHCGGRFPTSRSGCVVDDGVEHDRDFPRHATSRAGDWVIAVWLGVSVFLQALLPAFIRSNITRVRPVLRPP